MKSIEELLRNLGRPEVLEFGLVTNRLPSVNIGGKFEPVDDEAPDTERVLQMLVAVGGDKHVDSLGERPVQWTARLDGIGVIAVAAIMRKDVVQARFTVARRETSRPASPSRPAERPPVRPSPAADLMAASSPSKLPAPLAPPQASSGSVKAAPPVPSRPPSALARTLRSTRRDEEDDEPTVQTLSPPAPKQVVGVAKPDEERSVRPPLPPPRDAPMGAPRGVMDSDPKAKPARRQSEVLALAATLPVGATAPVLEHRAAEDRAVAEQRAPREHLPGAPEMGIRRIPTPTSVDAVEDQRNVPSGPDLTIEPADATLEVTARARVAASPLSLVPSEVPTALPARMREAPDGALVSFLAMAAAARASDLIIVAGRPVLLRVAEELVSRTQPILAEHVERIACELVPPRYRAQLEADGSCDFSFEHPQHGRFRVNVARQRTGYKVSMRVIPREVQTLAALGLPESLRAIAKLTTGLVLVTGPQRHGKTTTLTALVDVLARETARHILTVEDPIEIHVARQRALVRQREVGTHARTAAAAVRAALREDVDVVVIGELRDVETLRIALEASEQGRLVIATMCGPSAARTIDRILESFGPEEEPRVRLGLASALRLVVGQRLVPSVDRTCLHAAVELLPASLALYTLIREGRTFQIPSLQPRAPGVVRLDESLAELVRLQKVTLENAKSCAESAQELEAPRFAAARKA